MTRYSLFQPLFMNFLFIPVASSSASTCSEFEFSCKSDGLCIPLLWKCDLAPDCADGSDEKDAECELNSIAQEKCDNDDFFHCEYSKKCIPRSWLCDQTFDCGLIGKFDSLDVSDEESSRNCTIKCPGDKLPCSNGICLPISKFCDGVIDCPDDEFYCTADKSACKSLKCDYECKITPHGPHCFCPKGQEVVNSTRCVVSPKCTEDSTTGEVCDQQCINVQGENRCSCISGYERINSRCLGINCKCLNNIYSSSIESTDADNIKFP